MLTLLTLATLLQAPVPMVSADLSSPSLEAGPPPAAEPQEVTQLAQFVGKHLLSWDFSGQSTTGLKIRQGERTFAITDDLSEAMHLVPRALELAQSAQRDFRTGTTLLIIGGVSCGVGLVMELTGLLLLATPTGLAVAIIGVAVALLGLVPMMVAMRYSADATAHFGESVAVYNRGLLALRPSNAVSGAFSPPPLLRF